MDLKELTNFLKTAEYENITKAAQELHIAQPYLTRQIQGLEEELGVSLFTREKKRIHITDEGRFLKQQAEQILALTQKTKDQISEMESGLSGTLYIGSIETAGIIYLPKLIAAFKKEFPKVNYNLWSGNSNDVLERLEKGLIDIALVREPFDKGKFNSFSIVSEEWIVLVNKNHQLAQHDKSTVTLEELSKEELLVPTQRVAEITNWFERKNRKANIVCSFSPLINGIVMVQNNIGAAILPKSCSQMLFVDDVVVKELDEKIFSTVSFAWKKNYEMQGVAKRFLDFAEKRI